jgi:hypothetical protein
MSGKEPGDKQGNEKKKKGRGMSVSERSGVQRGRSTSLAVAVRRL